MHYDPPPPGGEGGVVRAEFDPGSENAIPAALRRQMTTTRGGRAKFDPRNRIVTPIAVRRILPLFANSSNLANLHSDLRN